MDKINELNKMKLKITWKLIEIGYNGNDIIKPQLSKNDIAHYLEVCILKNEKDEGNILLLGDIYHGNQYEFEIDLEKIASKERSDRNVQVRKWIVYLTKRMLDNLQDDWQENLLAINEFWISLKQPENSPHIFQGVNNDIEAKEYYTKEMYELIVNRHNQWIEKEIEQINLLESIFLVEKD